MQVKQVPVGQSFMMNIAAMKKQASAQKDPVLVSICNPNNSTGNIVDFQVLFDWINNAPIHIYFHLMKLILHMLKIIIDTKVVWI